MTETPLTEIYHAGLGRQFRFNDLIVGECFMDVPDEKRVGRLVQVRKGVGQFGSDRLVVRLRDGNLVTWENVMVRRADDERFVYAFYTCNDMTPPVIPPESEFPMDEPDEEYTLDGEWAETGFIIHSPKEPDSPVQSFSMIITRTNSLT